ncbi:MAG: VOC family protein [Pseudomonadota bacterium]
MLGARVLLAALLLGLVACGESESPAPEVSADAAQDRAEPNVDATADLNLDVDPMEQFGTTASNVFFYYEDLAAAEAFYRELLGLRLVADYGFAKILQVAPKSFLTLVDADEGMHSAAEPKTTAIALITDQLDEWWDYIETLDIDMRSTEYDPQPGRAHHGFVAIDPEGYFLEFERFNEHPENVDLLPMLNDIETLYPEPGTSSVPEGLGFKATVIWFYYKDMAGIQSFYENTMGFDLIVDQGWAKIYQVGPTGFFGPVDETRGMHSFTEEKGVTMSFLTADIDGWHAYLAARGVELRHDAVVNEEPYRAFVAYDPEGYYLEWDVFNDVPANQALLEALGAR